jgi:hypothetical protein
MIRTATDRIGGLMNEIVNAISQVGFPIVCTMILAYILYNENDKNDTRMIEFVKAIDSNTKAISELIVYIKNGMDKNE